MFFHHEVFSEIAIATILSCIQEDNKAHILNVLNRWDDDRDKPWEWMQDFINNNSVAYHPVKWSGLVGGDALHKDFYCSRVIPWLQQEMDTVVKDTFR